jgi:ABC-type multidrug transport system ATPase subunit/pSer/pThr/pTyr-binding forkhead associated (FHA) protein
VNPRQVQVWVPSEGTGALFGPGAEVVIGRGEDAQVVVRDLRASRHHAVLHTDARGAWLLEDRSTRGTFVDGRAVTRLVIDGPQSVRLGDPHDGVVVELTLSDAPLAVPIPAPRGAGVAFSSVYRPTARFRIGRGLDNDIVIPDLLVSRQHAELRTDNGRYQIVDLGSDNGTYVDGRRVTRAEVTERSVVTIGHHLYRLRNGRLEEYVDRGQASFAAVGLSVHAGDKVLLSGVSFALGASAFLAVLGPTGAGKSTLIKALTGSRPADEGQVLYNGRDLYQAYPELRHRIGYVPQDDILHPGLTVRQGLGYAAQLRFPADVSADERHHRVEEVMAELGLTSRADLQVLNLSGGQRKRVSVAIELLTRPSLILLDEPTSGLDPGYEKSVMTLLRTLADGGRTVITVTHSIQSLDLCDRLLFLAPGGDLAYFGPPGEALGFFGQPQYADVFQLLDRCAPGQARSAFAESPLRQRYLQVPLVSHDPPTLPPQAPWVPSVGAPGDGFGGSGAVGGGSLGGGSVSIGSLGGGSVGGGPLGGGSLGVARPNTDWGHQLVSLLRRYVAVIVADRRNTLLLVAQAPLLGLLMLAVLGEGHLRPGPTGQGASTTVLVALTLSATYLGATNSIREIVKERAILTRERSVGLSGSAYVVSKALTLGVLTVVQSVILVLLATARQNGPGHGAVLSFGMLELIGVVSLTGLAAMALGLMISAFVTNPDKALTLLPIVLFAEFLLSGGALSLGHSPVVRDIGYLTGARWGEAAASATVDIDALLRTGCNGAPSPVVQGVVAPPGGHGCNADFRHDPGPWVTDVVWLLGLTAVPLGGAIVAIRPIGQPRRR